jgi:hypothetical protein
VTRQELVVSSFGWINAKRILLTTGAALWVPMQS